MKLDFRLPVYSFLGKLKCKKIRFHRAYGYNVE